MKATDEEVPYLETLEYRTLLWYLGIYQGDPLFMLGLALSKRGSMSPIAWDSLQDMLRERAAHG